MSTIATSTLSKRTFIIKNVDRDDTELVKVPSSASVESLIDSILKTMRMKVKEKCYFCVKGKDLHSYKSLIDIPLLTETSEYSEIYIYRPKTFKIELSGRPDISISQKFYSGIKLQNVKESMQNKCTELFSRAMTFTNDGRELLSLEDFMEIEDGKTIIAELLFTINVKYRDECFAQDRVRSTDSLSSILNCVQEESTSSTIDEYESMSENQKRRRRRCVVECDSSLDSCTSMQDSTCTTKTIIKYDPNLTMADLSKDFPLSVAKFRLILEVETFVTLHEKVHREDILRTKKLWSHDNLKSKLISSNPNVSEIESDCGIVWGSQKLDDTTVNDVFKSDIDGLMVHLSRRINVLVVHEKCPFLILEVTDDIHMDKFLITLRNKLPHKSSSKLVFECNGIKLEATSECIYQYDINDKSIIRVFEEEEVSFQYRNKVYKYVCIYDGESFNEILKKTNFLIKTFLPPETKFKCVCGKELSNEGDSSGFSHGCCKNRSKCLTVITPVNVRLLGNNGFFTTEVFHSMATVQAVIDNLQQKNGEKVRVLRCEDSNIVDPDQTLDSLVKDDDEITIHIEFEMPIIVSLNSYKFIWKVWPSQTLWDVISDLNKYCKEKLEIVDFCLPWSLFHTRYGEKMKIREEDGRICLHLQEGVIICTREKSRRLSKTSLNRGACAMISEEECARSLRSQEQLRRNLSFSVDSDRKMKVLINDKEYWVEVPDRIKPEELAYFLRRESFLSKQIVSSIVVCEEKEARREVLPSQKLWNQYLEVTTNLSVEFNTKSPIFMVILFTPFRRSQSIAIAPKDLGNIMKEISYKVSQNCRCNENRIWYSQVGRYFSEDKEHGVATVFPPSQGTVFVSESRVIGLTRPMQICKVTVTNILHHDQPFIPIAGTPKIEVYLFTKFYRIPNDVSMDFVALKDGCGEFTKPRYIAYLRGMVTKNGDESQTVHYVNTVSGNYYDVKSGEKFLTRTSEKGKPGYYGHSVYLIDQKSFLKFGNLPSDERVKVFIRDETEIDFQVGRFVLTKSCRTNVHSQRWLILENNHPVHAAMRNFFITPT